MLHRVTNLGDQDVTIRCYQVPEFNFLVKKSGHIVWSHVTAFKHTFSDIDLRANESIERTCIWDMINYENNLIEPGIYDVVGIVYNIPPEAEVSIPITVIPEPGSLVLLMTGVPFLIKKAGVKL